MHLRGRALVAAVLLLVVSGVTAAQDARPRVPESLRLQAAAGRRVRVIVGVREATVPEGRLSVAGVAVQRTRIRTRVDDVLRRLPASDRARVRRFATIPFVAADVSPATLVQLEGDPDVASIEEDVASRPTLSESVPLVGAPTAWQAGGTGAGWAIAVLDTGVEATHPFLAGKVVSEACYSNAAGSGGEASLCPGGVNATVAPGAGLNCSAFYSGCDHGTHVAGIAAGRGSAFNGVAPDAGVIAIQVFTGFSAASCGGTPCAASFSSDQILGLERVLALKGTIHIASVNMSLGGSQIYTDTAACDAANPSRKAAIDNLRSAGIATVVAAGNAGVAGGMSAPACISSAISVGATTKNDEISSFSNAAAFLDLLAPGSSITSSIPGGGYAAFSGTSMAAPHVAGAWALIKSLAPSADVTDVLAALQSTGSQIVDSRVVSQPTYPRIRIDQAIARFVSSLVSIDVPAASSTVEQPFGIGGWALNRASTSGPGVDALHVWAFPADGSAATFVGAATYGETRNDVAAVFGSRFANSGFDLLVRGLPPAAYRLVAYAHNATTGAFDASATRSVVIAGPVSRPFGWVDQPGAIVGQSFTIAGWAIDFGAAAGCGVDAIHTYAVPANGQPIFLGASTCGVRRDDVGAAFGAQFRDSGYMLTVAAPPPGAYTLIVYARSVLTGEWRAETRAITVRAPGLPAGYLDTPVDGATVGPRFVVAGWAIDLDAVDAQGAGIDAIHVYAVRPDGAAIFLGATTPAVARSDIAAVFGARFRDSGYGLTVSAPPPGAYTLVVYARSAVTGQWTAQTRAIAVRTPGLPVMSVDTPVDGTVGTQPLFLAGWAADLDAVSGPGVDVVHVWAIDAATGAGTFVGAVPTGDRRDDVGAALGSQFATAGFTMMVNSLAPGTYQLIVYAHSTVTDTFSQAHVVTITIGLVP